MRGISRFVGHKPQTGGCRFRKGGKRAAIVSAKVVRNKPTSAAKYSATARNGDFACRPTLSFRPIGAVQHNVSDMLAGMGVHVLTDDVVRTANIDMNNTHFLSQWAYPNRIMKAAEWCAKQDASVQFVQMTSFGCGPDAFLCDEVRELLLRNSKSYTLLKLDDINNVGSMRLCVRRNSTLCTEWCESCHQFAAVRVHCQSYFVQRPRKTYKRSFPND